MDLGTDINKEWTLTESGDLKIISGTDNVAQAIANRLSCTVNSLNLYYTQYGSMLFSFLGWRRNQRTLDFMEIEIGNRLSQEPRVRDYDISLGYSDDHGGVDIDLHLIVGDGESLDLNLVLDETGNVRER